MNKGRMCASAVSWGEHSPTISEWAEAPEEVIGVILAIIQDPTKLHAFFQKPETT